MQRIPLVNGRGFALVDDADVPLVSGHRWYLLDAGHTKYALTVVWRPKRRTVYMHALISGVNGADHRDGNGLNNQRSNLRPATVTQNNANMRPKGGASPYKGVSRARDSSRWRAQIRMAGRSTHLGCFDTEEEAARAYDAAALEQWGEYAQLNFPR